MSLRMCSLQCHAYGRCLNPTASTSIWHGIAISGLLWVASMAEHIDSVQGRHCRAFTLHAVAAQGLSYQETEGDEVEDMLQLAAHVHHCRAFHIVCGGCTGPVVSGDGGR